MILGADWVLPMDGPPLRDAAVRIEGGVIAEVSDRLQPDRRFADAVILPGLVNAHTHLEYGSMSAMGDGLPFTPWIERRAVDILQPDCTKNGGLSESRRIAWLAFDHNVQVVPHGWNTALGLAADLQFSAAIPVARYVEYLTPCAYIDEITVEPFRLDDKGFLTIPTRPGLGVEIDVDKLTRFCPERVVFQ